MADTLLQEKDFERLETRHKLALGETEMSGVAKSHGIGSGQFDYANFKNAGYKGLYNMTIRQLEKHKGFVRQSSSSNLYDRMSNVELAANLFRVTQTSEHIKNNNIRGQRNLEEAAKAIGKKVRAAMETPPEEIPLEPNTIKDVKKLGKTAAKKMKTIDKPEKAKRKKSDS